MIKSSHPPIRRMIFIDEQIRQEKYPNCTTLAKDLEVCKKTIQKDIAFLRDQLRAPIEFNSSQNGYVYTKKNYFLPALNLKDKDIFAIKVIENILKQYRNSPYFNEIKQIFEKLLKYIPDSINTNAIESSFVFDASPESFVSSQLMLEIKTAIMQSVKLDLSYHSFKNDQITQRVVDPYCILNKHQRWYLVALCHLREKVRMFAINRIQNVKILQEKFEKDKNFSINDYLEDSFYLERGTKTYKIELHISAHQAKWITERKWHNTQKIKKHRDGSITMTMKTASLNDIKRWVLQYGGEIKVVKPKELRNMIEDEVKKMVQVYGI